MEGIRGEGTAKTGLGKVGVIRKTAVFSGEIRDDALFTKIGGGGLSVPRGVTTKKLPDFLLLTTILVGKKKKGKNNGDRGGLVRLVLKRKSANKQSEKEKGTIGQKSCFPRSFA